MPSTSVSLLDYLDQVAVVSGGLFAGAALFITIGEVPAMQELGVDEHWRFFPLMYSRAALSQSIFTMSAGLSALAHGFRQVQSRDRNLWFTAGSIFVGMMPYTIICMLPTNNRIINDNRLIENGEASQFDQIARKELLEKWNLLHIGRTVGSVLAFGLMVYGLSKH